MPIDDNVDCMNAYDANDTIPVESLGGVSSSSLHHALHCVSFEILRGWMALGATIYNNQTLYDLAAPTVVTEAVARASLNPASALQSGQLTTSDKTIARQQGESYFEQGYPAMIAAIEQVFRKNFKRADASSVD